MDRITHTLLTQKIPQQVVGALRDRQDLAGWFHNPYAMEVPNNNDPDVVATRIAEHYIELFTEALHKRGFMPFSGVEINFDAHRQPLFPQQQPLYNSTPENEIIYRLRTIADHFLTTRAHEALMRDETQGQYREDYAALMHTDHTGDRKFILKNKECTEWLEYMQKNGIPQMRDIDNIRKKFLEETGVSAEWKSHFTGFAETLEQKAKSFRSGLFHNPMAKNKGLYLDSDNVEVCTPVLSPIETVQLVNFYKRIFFESSANYMSALKDAGISAEDAHALRHDVAKWIRAEVSPYTITYSKQAMSSGEHLSLSMQYDPERTKDYQTQPDELKGNARNTAFSHDNIMQNFLWLKLLNEVLQKWLPQDGILAIGLDSAKAAVVNTEESRISRSYSSGYGEYLNTPDKQRVETRNYGHSGSNVALAMLGQVAALYAIVTSLDPETMRNPKALTEAAANAARERIEHQKKPTLNTPCIYDDLVKAFEYNGLTLDMMKKVAEESARGQGELETLLADRHRFKDAVCKRAAAIMEPQNVRGRG